VIPRHLHELAPRWRLSDPPERPDNSSGLYLDEGVIADNLAAATRHPLSFRSGLDLRLANESSVSSISGQIEEVGTMVDRLESKLDEIDTKIDNLPQ
jgi:hypothetical protein